MKQGDYVQIYTDPIQRTIKESMGILQSKVAETPMLEIWVVELRPSGKVEQRPILKPKTSMFVTMFAHNPFLCGDKAGLASMREIDTNIRANGWKIVDAKPANDGQGLEIHLEGYRDWIKIPRATDEL